MEQKMKKESVEKFRYEKSLTKKEMKTLVEERVINLIDKNECSDEALKGILKEIEKEYVFHQTNSEKEAKIKKKEEEIRKQENKRKQEKKKVVEKEKRRERIEREDRVP